MLILPLIQAEQIGLLPAPNLPIEKPKSANPQDRQEQNCQRRNRGKRLRERQCPKALVGWSDSAQGRQDGKTVPDTMKEDSDQVSQNETHIALVLPDFGEGGPNQS